MRLRPAPPEVVFTVATGASIPETIALDLTGSKLATGSTLAMSLRDGTVRLSRVGGGAATTVFTGLRLMIKSR